MDNPTYAEIGPFLAFLGGLWITYLPFQSLLKSLNDARDKVLAPGLLRAHRELILKNDWYPLLASSIVEQLLLIALLFVFPTIISVSASSRDMATLFCYALGAFAALRLAGFAYTMLIDRRAMIAHLRESLTVPGDQPTPWTPSPNMPQRSGFASP